MGKNVSLDEHERVKKALYDEILRRDKLIEKLKSENELLLKTALKRAEAIAGFGAPRNVSDDKKNVYLGKKRKP